jgi:HEPN domain-containing protein
MPDPEVRSAAARWLASADGDLALARAAVRDEEAPARGVAFFAQQALEKALKSILVWEQVDFPSTHDLAVLASRLPAHWTLPFAAEELDRLTDFAVDTRYPLEEWGKVQPVTDHEAEASLQQVADVVATVATKLEALGLIRLEKPE